MVQRQNKRKWRGVIVLVLRRCKLKVHQIYTLGNDYLKFLTHLTWVIALTEFSMRK